MIGAPGLASLNTPSPASWSRSQNRLHAALGDSSAVPSPKAISSSQRGENIRYPLRRTRGGGVGPFGVDPRTDEFDVEHPCVAGIEDCAHDAPERYRAVPGHRATGSGAVTEHVVADLNQ